MRERRLHLAVGGSLLLVYLALAALGPWLAPFGPNEQDLLEVLAPVPEASRLKVLGSNALRLYGIQAPPGSR